MTRVHGEPVHHPPATSDEGHHAMTATITSASTTTTSRSDAAATRSRTPVRGILTLLFAVYLALLVWIVLWKFEVPWIGDPGERVVKLVPFVDTAQFGASAPREVLANLVFFVPFGVYLGLLAPRWSWWRATLVVAATSLGLEIGQYVMATGSSDSTDVIVNTAGGLAGLVLLGVARPALGSRTTAVVTWLCAIGTVFALLASLLLVASPLQYGPPMRHVGGEPPMTVSRMPR
ncbi:VanZ family protein [Agromyces allii]|uniref:VanZ-like domain-containing protein n=1 Tax=Agromyces allii TaxID=393607 RepID=A0ABN2RAE1_9MICO|nr:VanZ family protein [Agromyces allii]